MKSRGFTLIEVMVAIAIVAILTSIAFRKFDEMEQRNKIDLLHLSVDNLSRAANFYLRQACNSGSIINPTITELVNLELLDSPDQANNPIFDNPMTISVNWSAPISYEIRVNMLTAANASYYLRSVGANAVDGQFLVWNYSVNFYSSDYEGSKQFSRLFEGVCN